MGDAMTCDSCGAILQANMAGDLECWNEECTGVFRMQEEPSILEDFEEIQELSEEVERHMTNPIDVVNNPNHYKLFPDLEVIEAIEKLLTPEEFKGYKKGNSLKYRLRAGKKDSIEQDISKALKYEAWLYD